MQTKNKKPTRFSLIILIVLFYSIFTSAAIVKTITIEGNLNTNAYVIKNTSVLQEGKPYLVQDAQKTIKQLFNLGLYSNIELLTSSSIQSDSIDLIIKVSEYPILDSIEFDGNSKLDNDFLLEEIGVLTGFVAPHLVKKAENTIINAYHEEGYLLAKIKTDTVSSSISGHYIFKFNITENKKVQIKSIIVEGAIEFKESKVLAIFEETKESRWWRSGDYNEDKFLDDLELLKTFYKNEGFLDMHIEDYQVNFNNNNEDIFINVKIQEGKKYYLGNILISGNTLLKENTILKTFTIDEGEVFSDQQFMMSKYQIESLYREEGYLWVALSDEKVFRNDTVDINFKIQENTVAYVNKVEIRGNNKTLSKVIRREIHLLPGEKYKQSKMMLSQRDLNQLNFFDAVKPDIRKNNDGTINLIFDISERETGTGQVSAGAGYSERDGLMLTAGLAMPNFSLRHPFTEHAGQTVDLKIEWGKISHSADIGLTEPFFLNTPTLLGFRAFYSWRDWDGNYDLTTHSEESRQGVELRLGRRLRWPDLYFRVSSTYSLMYREFVEHNLDLEEYEARPIQEVGGIDILSNGLQSSLSFTISRNSTDLPDFPTVGAQFSYSPTFVGGVLGGDYKYLKQSFSLDAFIPVFSKFTYHQGVKVKTIAGSSLGQYDHFLAGGVNYDGIIRGYPDRAFGSLVEKSEHIGYNLLVLSSELRFPILPRQLYMSLFADFGNTWATFNDIDLADLKTGVGAGAQLLIPMLGLLGFDVAYGLNSYATDVDNAGMDIMEKSGLETHFRIGRPF